MSVRIDWKPIWWTTLVVTITNTVIGNILRLAERIIDKAAYTQVPGYFDMSQPDYFPLLFLFVSFFITFAIVWVYRMLLPMLPSSWQVRGLLLGGFLFLIGDLPNALLNGYVTTIPATAARGAAVAALINQLINGCILTYCYRRFSSDWKKE